MLHDLEAFPSVLTVDSARQSPPLVLDTQNPPLSSASQSTGPQLSDTSQLLSSRGHTLLETVAISGLDHMRVDGAHQNKKIAELEDVVNQLLQRTESSDRIIARLQHEKEELEDAKEDAEAQRDEAKAAENSLRERLLAAIQLEGPITVDKLIQVLSD